MTGRESSASRIAVHEAGHAVMAHLCRRRVGAASAVPHGEVLGQLEYGGFTTFPASWLDDARARRKLENEIMIALAGLAAEYVEPIAVDHAGAAADLARALGIALVARFEGPLGASAHAGMTPVEWAARGLQRPRLGSHRREPCMKPSQDQPASAAEVVADAFGELHHASSSARQAELRAILEDLVFDNVEERESEREVART